MAMVTITKGGITTEVPRGELDWYKRNGWAVPGDAPAEPVTPPVEESAPVEPEPAEEEKPAKKSAKK